MWTILAQNILLLEGCGHILSNLLNEGFYFGFKIPHQGPKHFWLSQNVPSTKEKAFILTQRIQKELQIPRKAGLYVKIM